MKKGTHPQYQQTVIVCNTCKKEYSLGSTVTDIKVELCANCHPFYTGKQTLVDTDNLVEKFNKKRAATEGKIVISKKIRRQEKKKEASSKGAVTLKDMLSQIK